MMSADTTGETGGGASPPRWLFIDGPPGEPLAPPQATRTVKASAKNRMGEDASTLVRRARGWHRCPDVSLHRSRRAGREAPGTDLVPDVQRRRHVVPSALRLLLLGQRRRREICPRHGGRRALRDR